MPWALRDIGAGLARGGLWFRLAMTDIQQTYRRSIFGAAWIALSFGAFVLVKIFVFGSFVPGDVSYFSMWVAIGFWVWMLVQGAVVDGCNVFVNSRSWILGTSLPLSIYVFQAITRVMLRFIWSIPVIAIVIWHYDVVPTVTWLWAIPGLILIVMNIIWAQIFLGVICARFRDVAHLVQSIMLVMFFLTPILYIPSMLKDKAYLLVYNPFTHFLALMRGPMVDNVFPVLAWHVTGSITIIGWIVALVTYQTMGRKVPFMV